MRKTALSSAALFALFALSAPTADAKRKATKKPAKKPAPSGELVLPASDPARAPITPPLPSAGPDAISFGAVGDIMLGTTFPEEGLLPPDDGVSELAEVTPILSAFDIAFGNLEGPLLDGGSSDKCTPKALKASKCFAFRTPTHYGKYLKDAGFDVMSLANNHAMDFGKEGRESTRKILDDLGIAHAGEVGDIAHLTVKGKKLTVLAFAASESYLSPTFYDIETAKKMVADAAKSADIVVVSFHGGREGRKYQHFNKKDGGVDAAIYDFAHAVIDSGADLVVGHGPHVLRGMEVYKGRLIAYSLGNFSTYRKFGLSGPSGWSLILEVKLGLDGAFLGGQIHPARQDFPGGPKLSPAGEAVDAIRALSGDFGKAGVIVSEDGSLKAP